MKKLFIICSILLLTSITAQAEVSFATKNETTLPIAPPTMKSCERTEQKEIKDSIRINSYDNVPIFNGTQNKKVNFMLKQPNSSLGNHQ